MGQGLGSALENISNTYQSPKISSDKFSKAQKPCVTENVTRYEKLSHEVNSHRIVSKKICGSQIAHVY